MGSGGGILSFGGRGISVSVKKLAKKMYDLPKSEKLIREIRINSEF